MKSATVFTREIDDMQLAARELVVGIQKQLTLEKNACGILFYDYETDGDELARYLQQALSIEILGCSTIAAIGGEEGYHEMVAMLTVLTAADCEFAPVVTEPLTLEDNGDSLIKAYRTARARLSEDPKLIFAIPPCGNSGIFEHHMPRLTREAKDAPIVGGIPSSNGGVEKSVLLDGTFYTNRAVLLLVSGNLNPLISLANVITLASDKVGVISKAEYNELLEVDGKTFVEYIAGFGMDSSDLESPESLFFHKYPLVVEDPVADDDGGLPFVRILSHVNPERASGVSYAKIPQNGRIRLGILQKKDLMLTIRNAAEELLANIQKDQTGRHYNTVLCITCSARHQTLAPDYSSEGELLRELIPEAFNLFGYYSYGELCPMAYHDGKAINQLHHASVVLCAF